MPPSPPEDEESLFATMPAGINFDKYDDITVEVTGRNPPKHISTFEECGFSESAQKNVERCKYTRPTPVQKYAIPIIMAGRDLMACAQTGSGKTVSREECCLCVPVDADSVEVCLYRSLVLSENKLQEVVFLFPYKLIDHMNGWDGVR